VGETESNIQHRTGYVLVTKAVNREDKRSRRYRDRHFAKFERSRRAVSLAGVETAIWFFETQPGREREPDR